MSANATPAKSKADKFREGANKSVNKALAAIAEIKKLGNPKQYEYTPEQVGVIRTALQAEVDAAVGALTKPATAAPSFAL